MAVLINELRPVFVVGIGFHRYQRISGTTYVELGLTAIREALADAKVEWRDVESSYVATALLGAAPGRPMLRHLGALGRPLVHIENASASGSAAFRLACIEVAAGISDMSLVVGVDKPSAERMKRSPTGIGNLAEGSIVPFTHFALLTDEYLHKHSLSAEDLALVAVKNHANGAKNPIAQRQQQRTLEDVMGGNRISGSLTTLQCTPVGEGAAAVIVASEDAIRRANMDGDRAIRVAASTTGTERAGRDSHPDTALSAEILRRAMFEADLTPADIDILELHDAFTVEEALYSEASGICRTGEFVPLLKEGAFNIGGRCAISPSGGLLAMGHPGGPTGIGQINEIVRQLRGEARERQHTNARVGLAHMVGVGTVCYAHVLRSAI